MPKYLPVLMSVGGIAIIALAMIIFNRLVHQPPAKDLIPIEELWDRERPWVWIPLLGMVIGFGLMIWAGCMK